MDACADAMGSGCFDKTAATIAAKLEDPPSIEFVEMRRALRKNTLGPSTDTICGRVKGKPQSTGDVREMPLLHLVKENEVYIVDVGEDMMAAAAYVNICK